MSTLSVNQKAAVEHQLVNQQASAKPVSQTITSITSTAASALENSGAATASQHISLKTESFSKSIDAETTIKIACINKRLLTLNKIGTVPLDTGFPFDFSQYELTKRLSKSQGREVMKSWKNSREELEKFAKLLYSDIPQLLKEDFECNLIPSKALEAVFHGLISESQFATLSFLHEAIDQLVINRMFLRTVRQKDLTGKLVTYTSVTPSTKHPSESNTYHLHKVFSEKDYEENKRLLKEYFVFTDLAFEIFIKALRHIPPSEQVFYSFQIPLGSPISWSFMYATICNAVTVFHPQNEYVSGEEANLTEQQKLFILPSFSMFQLSLDLRYGESAVSLVPILGKCSTKTIEKYVLQRKRVVGIGLPGAEVSLEADGQYAGRLMNSMHDIYHSYRYSWLKENEQLALNHINGLFARALILEPTNQELKHLKWMLIDGELHNSVAGDAFGHLFQRKNVGWKPEFLKLVILNMVVEKEKWEKEFKLSSKDLLVSEQQLYKELEQAQKESTKVRSAK